MSDFTMAVPFNKRKLIIIPIQLCLFIIIFFLIKKNEKKKEMEKRIPVGDSISEEWDFRIYLV